MLLRHASCTTTRLSHLSQPIFLLQRYTSTTPTSISPPLDPIPSLSTLPRSLNPSLGLLLLDTPVPPSNWPSHIEHVSSTYNQTRESAKKAGVAVNARYLPPPPSAHELSDLETFSSATLYSPHTQPTRISPFSIAEPGVIHTLSHLADSTSGPPAPPAAIDLTIEEILVCTHGSRDCRCSVRGAGLVDALREEVERRGLGVRVGEVAHLGGHKWVSGWRCLFTFHLVVVPREGGSTHLALHAPPASP